MLFAIRSSVVLPSLAKYVLFSSFTWRIADTHSIHKRVEVSKKCILLFYKTKQFFQRRQDEYITKVTFEEMVRMCDQCFFRPVG